MIASTIENPNIEPHSRFRIDHISEEQLDKHAASALADYTEDEIELFGLEPLPEVSTEEVDRAKEALLRLPLVHLTGHIRFSGGEGQRGSTLYDTPVPASYLPEGVKTNTFLFDRELNLDEYVFMSWGSPLGVDDAGSFLTDARYAVLIDPQLITSDRTIATPADIAEMAGNYILGAGLGGEDESAGKKALGVGLMYASNVLRGRDWLNAKAKWLAQEYKLTGKPVPFDGATFGEIKHKGPIPRSAIIGVLNLNNYADRQQYNEFLNEVSGGLIEPVVFVGGR